MILRAHSYSEGGGWMIRQVRGRRVDHRVRHLEARWATRAVQLRDSKLVCVSAAGIKKRISPFHEAA